MKSIGTLAAGLCAMVAWSQIPMPAGKTTGPGVQAARDSKEREVLKTCKVLPPTAVAADAAEAALLRRQTPEITR